MSTPSHDTHKRRLVIIGGGFAGINLVKKIDKKKWDVTIVDRNNYHSFPPLFYQVASAGIEPMSIAFPFRREMRSRYARGAQYVYGDVKTIDVAAREVVTQFERIPYDSLVIAAGTTNNFFNIPDLQKHVYTMKSASQAIRCRNEILDRLERASICTDPERRKALLTFVVVGGGPTGVEVAGALGELKRYVVPREYPRINRDEVRVVLVEGADRLLRTMSEQSGKDAQKALGQLMVEVQLNKNMKDYTDGVVHFSDGSSITATSVVWTAGVTGEAFVLEGAPENVKPGPGNRWIVDEFNRVEGLEDVYALGDISLHMDDEYPRGCPQLAQVAIQQGRTLARNLNEGAFTHPFRYKDKGSMATIGRNRAVVDIGKMHLSGWLAWIVWMLVHLMSLLGMKNKFVVLLNWTVSYFTFSSGLRIIMRPSRYPLRSYWDEKGA